MLHGVCMNTTVTVDKNVELPVMRVRYPFPDLAIGDSFLARTNNIQVMRNLAYRSGKKLGRRFVARKCETGVRVWRVT